MEAKQTRNARADDFDLEAFLALDAEEIEEADPENENGYPDRCPCGNYSRGGAECVACLVGPV